MGFNPLKEKAIPLEQQEHDWSKMKILADEQQTIKYYMVIGEPKCGLRPANPGFAGRLYRVEKGPNPVKRLQSREKVTV